MALFPSVEWITAAIEALNAQRELPRALEGLGTDLAAVVEAYPPAIPAPVAVYGKHEGGRIGAWRMLVDEDDILELEPTYVLRAGYAVWKSLLRGEDPIKAALSGRVQVTGNLEALVRRAQYVPMLRAAFESIPTQFADEVK